MLEKEGMWKGGFVERRKYDYCKRELMMRDDLEDFFDEGKVYFRAKQ